ncbi:Auxilin-like protein and related proteins containing DnaJ domain [Handroanthus impetiginosus]|uniref:Auxilin-like protein and related proteins containing DnaJ domain n=1 Tax=Handroanthus impetiginosus TaxID=429701 RepID=A0A2G9GUL5_9LAMI|nr:Auxilin-like protein and related proteins containing DnaJ domain [Handroanthus impetiginosus]
MDESWRVRMGMPTAQPPPPTFSHIPNCPPRRSTEDTTSHRRKPITDNPLDSEDFNDVFGGPPRTILSRQFSTCFPRSSSSTSLFYEEIFQPPEKAAPPFGRIGRSLPEFRIPNQKRSGYSQQNSEKDGFYSDIFGWDDERMMRSRSRSKTSSSSVLSSEELSPLRPAASVDGGDEDVPGFAPKLRPINVRARWTPRRTAQEDYQKQQNTLPPFASIHQYTTETEFPDNLRSYPFGLSRRNASPETISLEPISNSSFRVSADDLELKSSSSPVSSVCQSTHEMDDEIISMDQDEDEAMSSSYVIEINGDNRDGACESNGVDEAIAWAKEKFQMQECETEKHTEEILEGHGKIDSFGSMDEKQDKWAAEEGTEQFETKVQTEMQMLDEKIRLWSTGKETDIRLLLSSLHHILWPNSGWLATPLTNIIEISQVKKAYQKARLCLHPDKLQQRGATLPQKYIAEKAFSVLQDAWAAFISSDSGKMAII